MIKLTRLDGMPTWINPAHIVSVTSGHDQDGNTMTCVYTTCTHDKGSVEFVREAPRHVARMCDNAVPEAYVAEFCEFDETALDDRDNTASVEAATYERDEALDTAPGDDLDDIDVIEEVPEMKH